MPQRRSAFQGLLEHPKLLDFTVQGTLGAQKVCLAHAAAGGRARSAGVVQRCQEACWTCAPKKWTAQGLRPAPQKTSRTRRNSPERERPLVQEWNTQSTAAVRPAPSGRPPQDSAGRHGTVWMSRCKVAPPAPASHGSHAGIVVEAWDKLAVAAGKVPNHKTVL